MGIDPGSNCTGYGIVDETNRQLKVVSWGGIHCNSKQSFPERLKQIYDELIRIMGEFSPDSVAIETLFFATNAQSALKLGQTRGVTLLAAINTDKPIAEYSPLEVKQSVVGYGKADKEQVRSMVTTLLKLKEKPEPLDASDALAIAICHIHMAKTKALLHLRGKG
ncbi:MAG: crossover junction endodeoxyribonuclease RuvC [Nitrospinae bacterium RIFCSPLOWO2_12_FULL_47_7]|nr:MAG: crossover junction endodeoxyribonuclease RuvC [Nitrospinae bacterium RIFCSPLOWO2_12_FULL_47_7]